MAVDLTIQLFAYELFNVLRSKYREDSRPYSESTIPDGVIVESHLNAEIIDAVICRQVVFREIYNAQFKYTGIVHCNSPSDFLSHLVVAFSDKSFKDLKVFDRLIATCAFTREMSLFCSAQGNNAFLKDDFQCWAMYFDTELKSTFYKYGGWKVLKSVAKSYALPLLAISMLSDTPYLVHVHLGKFATGIDDFYFFRKFHVQGNQTFAKLWVNFRIKNAKNPNGNMFNYSTVEGIEDILKCFKFFCDPLGERILKADFRRQNENFLAKFKGNEFLENLATQLSNCYLSYLTEDYSFHDGVGISPSPELFQDLTDEVQALTNLAEAASINMQALEIERLPNGKLIDHALTTQKTTFHTNSLLNDSPGDKTNNFSKSDVSEDQDKRPRTQDIETNNCLDNDTAIDQDRNLQTQDSETNNCLNNDIANDEDRKLQTQDSETNNCLNDTPIDEDRKLKTHDSEIIKFLNSVMEIDQDPRLQNIRTEENNLLEDGISDYQNQEKSMKSNMGLFKTYEDMIKSMQKSINVVLSHVTVFLDDHSKIHTEKEFALNPNLQVTKDSNVFAVENETSLRITEACLEGQEIQNGTKNKNKKKKKRKTKAGKVSTDNTPKQETDTDDTQDILRMALVLGCQPGVNYIRSTLTKANNKTPTRSV